MRSDLTRQLLGAALLLVSLWRPDPLHGQPCSLDGSFHPGLSYGAAVYSVALQTNGQILIGGSFYVIDGVAVANVARLNPDGSLDRTFNPGAAANVGYVNAIAIQNDGKIVIGGSFHSSPPIAPSNLVRLNADGSVDYSGFDQTLSVDGPVNSLAILTNGMIVLGGSFFRIDGQPRRSIARLNADGSFDASFDACVSSSAGQGATGLALTSNGKILMSGAFTFTNVVRIGIARLLANGNVDTTFAAAQDGIDRSTVAYSLASRSSGKVLLVGNFLNYRNMGGKGIVQLSTSGTVDSTFSPGSGIDPDTASYTTTVFAIALQSDGKAIIGGNFNAYNGQVIYGVARINSDGSLDPACDPGFGPDNSVSSFAIQSDGQILVAGKFTSVDNQPRNGLARLNGDHPPARLGLPSPAGGNGGFQLPFYCESQAHYALEASSDLRHWTSVSNFIAISASMTLIDGTVQLSSNRFYRSVTVP